MMRRVAPLDAVADDRVDRAGRMIEPFEEPRHLAQVELEVAVAEADQLTRRVLEPGAESATVAAVRLVVDAHPDIALARCGHDSAGDCRRAMLAEPGIGHGAHHEKCHG